MLGARKVLVEGDSQLILKFVSGAYESRSPNLLPIIHHANKTISRFELFAVRHIRRAESTDADVLANQALDNDLRPLDLFCANVCIASLIVAEFPLLSLLLINFMAILVT